MSSEQFEFQRNFIGYTKINSLIVILVVTQRVTAKICQSIALMIQELNRFLSVLYRDNKKWQTDMLYYRLPLHFSTIIFKYLRYRDITIIDLLDERYLCKNRRINVGIWLQLLSGDKIQQSSLTYRSGFFFLFSYIKHSRKYLIPSSLFICLLWERFRGYVFITGF